ncbi:MAG: response regulator, partial [Planctomycetota bacterium]|nr:response regulator [Planctomycetota bacterium]
MKAGVSQSRVLVVDDEPGICSLLRDLLTSEGHAVRTAANGRQALAMLDDFQPHLVVVDVRMPLMDGYEFLRHLRAKSDLPALSLIHI